MDCLAVFDDIGVPGKQFDCDDNELLNPRRLTATVDYYSTLSKAKIRGELSLFDAFYESNAHFAYAGFKSMPLRHKQLGALLTKQDTQIITIVRSDVASTCASFITAHRHGTWRREGILPDYRYRFTEQDAELLRGNVQYLLRSWKLLQDIPGAIALSFEDCCEPTFESPKLDAYFGRPVRFQNPRPPVSGAFYVENWLEFQEFVKSVWLQNGGDEARFSLLPSS